MQVEEKVIPFMQKHHLIPKNKTVLVGVSGGPDSMALLHFFHANRQAWNMTLIAVTVDHQLRGESSKSDVQYVEAMCEKWDIPCVAVAVDVKEYKKTHKFSTQVAARTLRYKVFNEQMHLYHGDYLALGHHADDQVETMLMTWTRTTNIGSVRGIPVQRAFGRGMIIRPFLSVTKKEIETYCHTYDIQPKIDATNLDTYYTRNFVRANIVPLLKKQNTNIHKTVQQLSESLTEDEQFIMDKAKKAAQKVVQYKNENGKNVTMDIPLANHYPIALQRRIYRLILDYLYDELPENLSYTHEEIFLSLLKEEAGNQVLDFPKQLHIEKSYKQLLFYFHQDKPIHRPFSYVIQNIPDTISLPNGNTISVMYTDEKAACIDHSVHNTYVCPPSDIQLPLHIRTRKPGDRMHYEGLQGTKKIKDILIDEKVPRSERASTYVLTDHTGKILWLVGLRKNNVINNQKNKRYICVTYRQH